MSEISSDGASSHLDFGIAVINDGGTIEYTNQIMRTWIETINGMASYASSNTTNTVKSKPTNQITTHAKSRITIEEKWTGLISKEQYATILSTRKPLNWTISVSEIDLQIHAYPYGNSLEDAKVFLIGYLTNPIKSLQTQLNEMKAIADELEAVFQNSYDAIYISDANGITLKTNDAIERLTGIPKHYYIGKDLRYLEKRGIVQKSVTFEVLKEKKPVSTIQENSLGKVILLTGSPIFDEQGEITRIVTNLRDISELNQLREKLLQYHKFHSGDEPIIYASKHMKKVIELASRVAKTDTTVLMLGESGVGKEVIARLIHRNSGRYENGAFIKVNCGAIPQELLESELFGYDSGAFTGAKKNGKPGMFELAHEGTIFLDEVGELPLNLQVKLLRVLQEQEFTRVGGVKPIKVNVRIIAATNRNLKKMVAEGNFREDLYYRIFVVPIEIPPLRKRKEDIQPLLKFYLDKFNRKYQLSKKLNDRAVEMLEQYEWPGNIRELANFIERILVILPTNELEPEHLQELLGINPALTDQTTHVADPASNQPVPITSVADHTISNTDGTSRLTDQKSSRELVEIEKGNEHLLSESHITLEQVKRLGFQATIEQVEKEILICAYEHFGSSYEVAKALQMSQSTAIRKAHKYGIRMKQETMKVYLGE